MKSWIAAIGMTGRVIQVRFTSRAYYTCPFMEPADSLSPDSRCCGRMKNRLVQQGDMISFQLGHISTLGWQY